MTDVSRAPAVRQLGILALGAAGVGTAMLAGRADLLAAILEPPLVARLSLAAAACLLGLVLALKAVDRVRASHPEEHGRAEASPGAAPQTPTDARELIRAVRLVFVAVAAFAAAAGWLIGSPVPIVAALLIAGVDVLETTFLLLVTAAKGDPSPQTLRPEDDSPKNR